VLLCPVGRCQGCDITGSHCTGGHHIHDKYWQCQGELNLCNMPVLLDTSPMMGLSTPAV
jgi:hypothetical protein